MARKHISKEEMAKQVAWFKELEPSSQAFLDTVIPGYQRLVYNVIGRGVTEDESLKVAITDVQDFNMTLNCVSPGNGAALHSHTTSEVFMPLTGRWSIFWGDNGENELILGPWDTISLPTEVMRGFRNVGNEDAYLLGILGGTDAGRVTWAPQVIEQARKNGAQLNEDGSPIRADQPK